MKFKFTIFLLFAFLNANATHIVGGHLFFNASKSAQYNYTVGLTMYFDALNGNPGAEDEFANIFIFRKRDNVLMASVQTPKIERKSITYANPVCGISTLQTYMITYALDVRLEVTAFSDEEGYYMIWDRCCRNNSITNIKNPGDAGSLFYLEFPPISKLGIPFVNSSPHFSEIKGDYACVNSPFVFDFGGTDADGDSLVYTLVTPRQGYSNRNNPSTFGVGSSNYPTLVWNDGITIDNVIPGSLPLKVNKNNGILSVTASNTGLYVFEVEVKEYRNKQLIGKVTRDFQLKVVDCPKQDPPKLLFKQKGKTEFYSGNQIIKMNKSDPNCFEVIVTDPSPNQTIKVNGVAVDRTKNYFSILPATFKTTLGNDTLRFEVCLEDCFVTYDNRPIEIQLIAEDETCPIPLQDTLSIYIQRPESGNTPPVVTTSLASDTVHVSSGKSTTFTVFGNDADMDPLTISASGIDFNMTTYDMKFPIATGTGKVSQLFSWQPPCNAKKGDVLAVNFLLQDQRCPGNSLNKSKIVYFIIDENLNNPPTIASSIAEGHLTYNIGSSDPITFDIFGSDIDTNLIALSATGRNFDLTDLGMQFQDKTGIHSISSTFNWNPECKVLQGNDTHEYIIDFTITDKSCSEIKTSIPMVINIEKSPNQEMPEMPNVLTPNGDGANDFLVLEDLPDDTCDQIFKDIAVYNRWGKQVYYSKIRKNWHPDNISAGYYYYLIRFTNKTLKSGLTIIK